MRIKSKTLLAALLALAGLVLGHSPAGAVLVDDWVAGDLIIGFRASGGQGVNTSYLINIGQRTLYTSTTPAFDLSLGNIGADLAAAYGATWFDRTDLLWSVFGTTESVSPTLYASRARTNIGVQSSPWPSESSAPIRTGTKTEILAVATAFNLLDATSNSSHAAFQTNSGNAGSYNYQVTANSGTDFGSGSQWTNIEGGFGSLSTQALDYYSVSSATTYRGVFSIDDAGQISFNAVPEPSTYALLALTGTIFMVFLRRRATQQS